MSAEPDETVDQFLQFVAAYKADYVSLEGKLVIDDPEVRRKLVTAIDSYTNVYRKGCTPPDSVVWDAYGNNKAFLAQNVVMAPNYSLSIVNALKNERPNDYYNNTVSIEWPLGPSGAIFPDPGGVLTAAVFKDGRNVASAKEFVRFLVAEGWLMHYLDFSSERFLPSISALLDQPFWLDPHDRHHMVAAMQAKEKALATNYTSASGNLGHDQVYNQRIWAKAIHRIVTEGISPEQAGGRRGDRPGQADPRRMTSVHYPGHGSARGRGRRSRRLAGGADQEFRRRCALLPEVSRNQAASSPSDNEPSAAPIMAATTSSSRAACSMPLLRRKTAATAWAVRLLPSRKTWPRAMANA
jgi:hypothetical protein